MTNAIKNFNSSIEPTTTFKIPFPQSETHFKVSGLVDSIPKKIKELSSQHLGSPTYLIANREDTVIQKVLKVSGWIFLVSPTILVGACLYDVLLDLYYQHFEKYSKLEECSNENESLPVTIPKQYSEKTENLSESTVPKTLQSEMLSISTADLSEVHDQDDISDTTTKSDGDSEYYDLDEHNFEMTDSTDAFDIPNRDTLEIEDHSGEEQKQESLDNEISGSLEKGNHLSPELLEEMKNTHEATPSRTHRLQQIWKRIQNFNPFSSKTWNVISSPNATFYVEPQEPSYKDFEILDPIIIDHKDTKFDTTGFSIDQIKKDLGRMKIFVNGNLCSNIHDFVSYLGLTLNTDETDILPSNSPVIPKILHFAHQGIFFSGVKKITDNLNNLSHFKLYPKQIEDILPTLHINWDPKFSKPIEIIAETPFQIKPQDPYEIIITNRYVLKIKCSLDREEITFTKHVQEEVASETQISSELKHPQKELEVEDDFVIIDSSKANEETEQSDEDFTIIGSSTGTESNNKDYGDLDISASDTRIKINHNEDRIIAFNHLKDQINSCLTSTITLEYLKSLKIKYPDFVFYDCLMLPISITTDEIANSLNNLKNNTSNQLIFLPFLINGWSVDHAVVAVINLSNETIEYFDPKGQSYILPTRKEKQSSNDVFDFLTEIGQKVISSTFSRDKIVYNKKNIPQGIYDNINCGAFCLQFIEKRITNSFDSIEDGRAIDPTELRRQLANKLIQNTYPNLV